VYTTTSTLTTDPHYYIRLRAPLRLCILNVLLPDPISLVPFSVTHLWRVGGFLPAMFLCYDTKLSFWDGSLTFVLGD